LLHLLLLLKWAAIGAPDGSAWNVPRRRRIVRQHDCVTVRFVWNHGSGDELFMERRHNDRRAEERRCQERRSENHHAIGEFYVAGYNNGVAIYALNYRHGQRRTCERRATERRSMARRQSDRMPALAR
jgi:hypothetical protein